MLVTALFFLVFFLVMTAILPAQQRVLISTGHTRTINDTILQSEKDLVFSAGDDGTLRVWDAERLDDERGKMLHKLQISHLPIVKIAVHPTKEQVALIETDRINTFHLSVWNYQTGEKVFSHKIDEIPLFVQFSPMGTYLIYGKTDWKSLTFLNSRTGGIEPVLDTGFGIVSDVFLSSSEKTLLTYSPSGMLRYWDLEAGVEKTSFSTVGDLINIQFAKNGVFMVGTRGRYVYLVNLVNGSVEAREQFEFLRGQYLDDTTNRLAIYFTENSRPRFQTFNIERNSSGWSLTPIHRSTGAPDFASPPLVLKGSRILFTRENGDMYTSSIFSSGESVFSSSILLRVSDLAFSDDSVLLAGHNYILKLTSEVFGDFYPKEGSTRGLQFQTERFENPIRGETGIISIDSRRFLIYPKGNSSRELYLFNNGFFQELEGLSIGPIQSSVIYGNEVLLLEKSGTLRLIDPLTGQESFSYSSFGLQSAVQAFQNKIILARNQTELINTTLLSIDPRTSETVPIPDRNLLTFHLAYDDITRSLYSLGFENRRGSIRTVLKQHQGSTYNRVSTLLSYPGEDNGATLAVDPGTSKVFTSLGYGDVHMFHWNGFSTMERVDHIPRTLYVHEGNLYSLNGDSSISIWNVTDGNLRMTLNIFNDLSWSLRFADGSFYSTDKAKRWIHTVE